MVTNMLTLETAQLVKKKKKTQITETLKKCWSSNVQSWTALTWVTSSEILLA